MRSIVELGQAVKSSTVCPLCGHGKTRGALTCRSCYRARRRAPSPERCRRSAPVLRSRRELAFADRLTRFGIPWAQAAALARLSTDDVYDQAAAEEGDPGEHQLQLKVRIAP